MQYLIAGIRHTESGAVGAAAWWATLFGVTLASEWWLDELSAALKFGTQLLLFVGALMSTLFWVRRLRRQGRRVLETESRSPDA